MDIDVKNSLDKVLTICDASEKSGKSSLLRIFAGDVYGFISSVSADHCKERYELFNTIYLNGTFPADRLPESESNDIPEILKIMTDVDFRKAENDNSLSNTIISFFLVLGRYYAANNLDRNDVSMNAVIKQIKLMQDYVKKNGAPLSKQPSSSKAKTAKAASPKKKAEKNTEAPSEKEDAASPEETPEETLEELLEKLDSLIGLNSVKQEVQQIINLIKVQKKGEEFGEKAPPLSLHLVFYGNPGTGKTTVARLLAKIYKCLGVLSSGQLVEVDRSGLVAGYVGQTAIKTQEVIDKAMGGILFIDEAYALTHGKGENDFGQEAVDTILKAMEDHRDDFIVIVAGYPDLMKEFVASNPGLKSRFNQFIQFEDYTPEELKQIFLLNCRNQGLLLTEECDDYLSQFFEKMYNDRSDDYANGRDVRNYFEKVIRARANRLVDTLNIVSKDEFLTINLADLQEAAKKRGTF